MDRFIALAWDQDDTESEAVAHSLADRFRRINAPIEPQLFNAAGLCVLIGPQPHGCGRALRVLDRGIVVGRLFANLGDNHDAAAAAELTESAAKAILASHGKALVEQYWGAYVAFLAPSATLKCVLRDPTGAIPCYFMQAERVTVFFSHPRDGLDMVPGPLCVNWRHVAAYLHFSRLAPPHTGFAQIEQVQAGECRKICGDGRASSSFYWNPAAICAADCLEDPAQAMALLERSIRASVRTWAGQYERILLELSGGLDSSITLMCLAEAPPAAEIVCLNMYTDVADGDERLYARKAAQCADVELVETEFRSSAKTLEQMLSKTPSVSPAHDALTSHSGDFRAELVRSMRIDAIFSGRGGDQLFQRRRGHFIAAEYVHRHGLGPNLPKVLLEVARLTGDSLWPVLAAALRYRLFKRARSPYSDITQPSFLQLDASRPASTEDFGHSWVLDAVGLPQSKTQQIFDLVDTQNYFTTESCSYADVVPALISQPVIECALRIPSYVLTLGGVDRGLLRRAFSSRVPAEIIRRTSKGLTTNFFQDLLRENHAFVRSFLLDGILISSGLVRKTALEALFQEQNLLRGTELVPLLSAIKAENWLRAAPVARS